MTERWIVERLAQHALTEEQSWKRSVIPIDVWHLAMERGVIPTPPRRGVPGHREALRASITRLGEPQPLSTALQLLALMREEALPMGPFRLRDLDTNRVIIV